MTLKIKLSSLTMSPEAFADAVKAYAAAKAEYAMHLEGVRVDALNADLKSDERRVAFPGPSADSLIERAATEGFEFEGPSLTEKKAALFARLQQMEASTLQGLMPSAKVRHWQFREQDIREADRARVALNKIEPADQLAFIERTRAPDDAAFMADQEARRHTQQAILRAAAKCEHDIDDLTEETVDAFTIVLA